jgi:asparagine N-glycosylation enzyme membrane subunit Stt3
MVEKTASSDGGVGQSRGWIIGAAIALFAFCVRALPLRHVFIDGQTYFTDSDSYYHLRRIAYNIASFPETLEHDPYLNFPDGAKAIWPQTLDWLLAALIWPFHSIGTEPNYERFLAWVPPLLGALTVLVVYRLVARHFGQREAIVAGLVLAILPAHYWYSQVGFLDHHVAVALFATLLLASTMNLLRLGGAATREEGGPVRRAAVFGFLQAASLAIWPGAILYVALSQAALVGLAIFGQAPVARKWALTCLSIGSVIALLVISPLSLGNEWPQWGPFSAVVLSNFQPWWFAMSTLLGLALMQVIDRPFAAHPAARAGLAIAVGLGLLAASALVLPDLGASFRESAQWLGKTDSFQVMVGESVPLFVLHGRYTTAIANSRLSYFIYLFPLAIVFLPIAGARTPPGLLSKRS